MKALRQNLAKIAEQANNNRSVSGSFKYALMLPVLVLGLVSWFSCTNNQIETLDKNELFSLSLGKMENQIDLFQSPDIPMDKANLIYLKAGRVYILNGNSSKVMEFTTYGDLISLIYNPQNNSYPVILSKGEKEEHNTNRLANEYAFINISHLVVDNQKNLYAVDEVPPEQKEQNKEYNTVNYQRVLRFNRDGKLKDFFGQEGVGGRGTPFSYIDSLHITSNDELVVISRLPPDVSLVYWFNNDGMLKYKVVFDTNHLPKEPECFPSLEKIIPDFKSEKIYLMLSFYKEEVNKQTSTLDSINLVRSRLYTFDLQSEKYITNLEIPQAGKLKEVIGSVEQEIAAPAYEFLGMTLSNHFFFTRPEKFNLYKLIVLDQKGNTVSQRLLPMDESDLFYKNISLSEQGIIIGLLCYVDGVKVAWWRGDQAITIPQKGSTDLSQ